MGHYDDVRDAWERADKPKHKKSPPYAENDRSYERIIHDLSRFADWLKMRLEDRNCQAAFAAISAAKTCLELARENESADSQEVR